MSRIQLEDDMTATLIKMAEGNPGAATVLMGIIKDCEKIDPDSAFGGLGVILSLDTYGIYGPRIWMLYKDVCEQDLIKTLAVLRGVQLGLLDEAILSNAIDNRGAGLDVNDILDLVRKELPEFGKT